MSIPLMLGGGASALYGLITNGKNPHTKTLKTGHAKTGIDARFILALVIAGFFDILDYLVVGAIPLAGDILDALAIILLFPLIGPYALIGAVEFVPILDLLPSNIASVVAWKLTQQKK